MRMTRLFFQTLREAPADAEVISHKLMIRACMIKQVAAGIFDYLPLGQRAKAKIEQIIREEMDAIGGQEVTLPVVHPAELWQKSGRWYQIGDDMARLKDRNGRDMCLGMTHEELMADIAQWVVNSYRQLPFVLYQIQTKFRDEPRPRAGTIRVREFTMKDAYSFDRDQAGLDAFYPHIYQAYFNVFRRAGMEVIAVQSDVGMMGGSMAHEFMALLPIGEDTIIVCEQCGYKANRQVAVSRTPTAPVEPPLPLEEVHTPNTTTIASLADYLGISTTQTAKAVFLTAQIDDDEGVTRDRFVFAVLRGDMELNETKLTNAIHARGLRPATVDEIRAVGAEPGYGSPIGIDRKKSLLVVDSLVASSPNLVAGANRPEYHLRNTNYGRDYSADMVIDLAAVGDEDACVNCGAPLKAVRGVEVGNIFKLGTKYSVAMGATYLDENGVSNPIVMGSYGIGSERLMACIIERFNDDKGIQWPISVAPYQISLVSLFTEKTPEVIEAAESIYKQLTAAGYEVLYDDRDERAGVKFKDADLLGMPLRLTVGSKGLQNGVVELKFRRSGEMRSIALDQLLDGVQAAAEEEWAWIRALLKPESLEE
jgi:prolyl-tRNA synthetase